MMVGAMFARPFCLVWTLVPLANSFGGSSSVSCDHACVLHFSNTPDGGDVLAVRQITRRGLETKGEN